MFIGVGALDRVKKGRGFRVIAEAGGSGFFAQERVVFVSASEYQVLLNIVLWPNADCAGLRDLGECRNHAGIHRTILRMGDRPEDRPSSHREH